MSEMELFHGYFEESNVAVEPEDTDEFIDFEAEQKCYFVKVNGKIFRFWRSEYDIDPYGFNVVIPASDKPQLFLYWYNGGAELHEVAEFAIRQWLHDEAERK